MSKLAKSLGVTIDDLILDIEKNNDNENVIFKEMSLDDVIIYLKASSRDSLILDNRIQLIIWLEELQELRCFKNRILNAIDNKNP